jgi:4'-phosphopantetheinyl transferase
MTTGPELAVHRLRLPARSAPEAFPAESAPFRPGWPGDAPPPGALDLLWVHIPERDPAPGHLRALTPPERERADRFRVDDARRRYVTGRRILRHWLGTLLHCPPENVPLRQSPTGKPELQPPPTTGPHWEFNLSHSGDRILAGLQATGRIGVDVEEIRPRRLLQEIAADYYHPDELTRLHHGGREPDLAAFYRIWTLKEAFIKAIGEGLRYPIRTLNFAGAAAAQGPCAFTLENARWRSLSLPVDPGYAAAVVWECPPPPS